MNKIKKIIISLSLFCVSSSSFSQQISTDPSVVQPTKINRDFSSTDIATLNNLLARQDYIPGFYEAFSKMNVPADKQIKYLEDRKYDGHVPLYWLMADYYAKKGMELETHKWLYIATILTQQDASLCSDQSSKIASQKIMRAFPDASDLARRTPQYITNAMDEVIYFINNLKVRSNPAWACGFGNQGIAPNGNILVPQYSWNTIRRTVLEKYTSNHRK